ncbi:MAG: hypothetical protein COB23_09490 [Methylophaga sp.]|nr:MAG: hypothetical protein COB23_09490 [Methylophaga sp.]
MVIVIRKVAKSIAVVTFGLIVPIVVVVQAYIGINSLSNNVNDKNTMEDLVANYIEIKDVLLGW